jgi:membrane protease YdiL (CAAX protease family)
MIQRFKKNIKKRPLVWFYVFSILIEVCIIPIFLFTDAQNGLLKGFEKSGLQFNTDLVTAFRVVLAAPEAFLGIFLSLVQVAAVDVAVFLIAIAYGQQGFATLKARFRFWKKDIFWHRGLRIWGVCILTFSAMNLATAALNKLLLTEKEFGWHIDFFSIVFLFKFLVAMFLDAGGLFEENGWRGFALPLLQSRFSPLKASIILGLMWFVWHIPVKVDTFFYGIGNAIAIFSILMIKFVLLSIIMTFFFNRVGGTTIIAIGFATAPWAIAMHGLSNDSVRLGGEILSDSTKVYLLTEINLVVPMIVVAIGLILKTKGRLGFRTGCDMRCSLHPAGLAGLSQQPQ